MSYKDFSRSGSSRVWLTLEDKKLAINERDVELDELHLYGGAQIVFIKPNAPNKPLTIVIGKEVLVYVSITFYVNQLGGSGVRTPCQI